jgi:hypothetical protein
VITTFRVAFLALLGVFASAGYTGNTSAQASNGSGGLALQACRGAEDVAAAVPTVAILSAPIAPLRPGLPLGAAMLENSVAPTLVRLHACTEVDLEADLVAARILTKYLHFRESLSSP